MKNPRSYDNRSATRDLGLDRRIRLLPHLRDGTEVTLKESVVWPPLSAAIAAIDGSPEMAGDAPLVHIKARPPQTHATDPDGFTPDHIRALLAQACANLQDFDVPAHLADLCRGDGPNFGSYPLYHLGALALARDTARLRAALASFDAGAAHFMLPYVKRAMVQRALDIAEGRLDPATPPPRKRR